jgi:hypothetical protein
METPAAGYSLQDAAAILGVSVNTLRKRIRDGRVRGEHVQRPQGHVWRVYLDPPASSEDPPSQEAPRRLQDPPTPATQAEAITAMIQTTIATVLGPLVAEQSALRQTVERQADEIAELREDRGRLTAENAALRAAQAQQEAQQAPPDVGSTSDTRMAVSPRLRALAPWLLAVLAIVGVVVLLLIPR